MFSFVRRFRFNGPSNFYWKAKRVYIYIYMYAPPAKFWNHSGETTSVYSSKHELYRVKY